MSEENQPVCNCMGCQAHHSIMQWQHIAFERLKEIQTLKEDQITYHDEDTLTKVYTVLQSKGLTGQQILNAIGEMQNLGLYFRERQP